MCPYSCRGSPTENKKRSPLFCKKHLGEIGESSDHYKEQIRNIF